jgi:drug/metabolite transporter (DMT)-like permease
VGNRAQMVQVYIAAVVYAIIFGLSFLFVKLSLAYASAIDMLAHRFTVSFVAFIVVLLVVPKLRRKISLRGLARYLPVTFFNPLLGFGFQVMGLSLTTSAEASIVNALIPIFALILAAIFLKDRPTGWLTTCVTLSMTGVIFVFVMNGLQPGSANLWGNVLIFGSALTTAIYTILFSKMAHKFSFLSLLFMMQGVGCIGFNLLAFGVHVVDGNFAAYFTPWLNWDYVLPVLYLGVLATLCSTILYNFMLSHLSPPKVTVFGNLATLITILAGIFILGEMFHWYHVVGTVLILVGVIGTGLAGRGPRPAVQTATQKTVAPK